MEVIIQANPDDVSALAARIFRRQLQRKPASVLGLATGATPLGLYRELARLFEKRELDFAQVTTFNLDEYASLARSHEQSYARYMRDNLFSKINVPDANIHISDGTARDIPGHCAHYER